MRSDRLRLICGWSAVAFSTGLACFWAFWGIIENFHEGWYGDSVLGNLGLMLVQYLSPMLLFVAMGLVSIHWKWVGGVLHAAVALAALGFFRPWFSTGAVLIATPLLVIGLLYAVGVIRPRKITAAFLVGLPLLVVLGFGIEPAIRVAGRVWMTGIGASGWSRATACAWSGRSKVRVGPTRACRGRKPNGAAGICLTMAAPWPIRRRTCGDCRPWKKR